MGRNPIQHVLVWRGEAGVSIETIEARLAAAGPWEANADLLAHIDTDISLLLAVAKASRAIIERGEAQDGTDMLGSYERYLALRNAVVRLHNAE